jgi:hypothetical protein
MGVAPEIVSWLGLRFVAGVASAWVFVLSSAWCIERLHEAPAHARQALVAALFSGVGIGIAIAGTICAAVLLGGGNDAFAWMALGVVALAGSGALWNAFGASSIAQPAGRRASSWDVARARLIVCYGAFGFGYIIPATFLASMARESIGDPAVYGWSWPVFGAAAAVSTFVAAGVRRRISDRGTWIAGHLLMAAGVVMPLMLSGLPGIVLSALLVGGTFMVVTMAGMQEARSIAGVDARGLMGAMTSAFALGQIAGPLAVSALASRGGGFAASLITAAGALVAGALLLAPQLDPRTSP